MEIRRAIPDDAPKIRGLEEECFSDSWSLKDILSYISSEDGFVYSVLDGGEVIAYIIGRVIAPEGEIYRIAVREDKRGRGIGYRLLSYAIKTERGRGLETVFLEVRRMNFPAISLYRAFGFREMGVRKNYYHNPEDDAQLMVLGLKYEFDN